MEMNEEKKRLMKQRRKFSNLSLYVCVCMYTGYIISLYRLCRPVCYFNELLISLYFAKYKNTCFFLLYPSLICLDHCLLYNVRNLRLQFFRHSVYKI